MFGSFLQACRRQGLPTAIAGGITICLALVASNAEAQAPLSGQEGIYQPMHQNMPPGTAGHWAGALGKTAANKFQPVRIELPTRGSVSVYQPSTGKLSSLSAPAMIGVGVGNTYRIRIAEMPEFPNVELYPSIEILDGLHPPAGKEKEFPVPVWITRDEIEMALAGRMVTKVVYLEQPNIAAPRAQPDPIPVLTLPAYRNLISEADRLGRPMVILRIGGRVPGEHQSEKDFLAPGAPVQVLSQSASGSPRTQYAGFESGQRRQQSITPSGYEYGTEDTSNLTPYTAIPRSPFYNSTGTPGKSEAQPFPFTNQQPVGRSPEFPYGDRAPTGYSN